MSLRQNHGSPTGPSRRSFDYDKGFSPFEVIDMGDKKVAVNTGIVIHGSSASYIDPCSFKSSEKPQNIVGGTIDESRLLSVEEGDLVIIVLEGNDGSSPFAELKAVKPEKLHEKEFKRKYNKIIKLARIDKVETINEYDYLKIESLYNGQVMSETENWPPFTPVIWPTESQASKTEGDPESCNEQDDPTWNAVFIPGSIYLPQTMTEPTVFKIEGEEGEVSMLELPVIQVKAGDEFWAEYEISKNWSLKGTPRFLKGSDKELKEVIPAGPACDEEAAAGSGESACEPRDGEYKVKILTFEERGKGIYPKMLFKSDIIIYGWQRCPSNCEDSSGSSGGSSGSSDGSENSANSGGSNNGSGTGGCDCPVKTITFTCSENGSSTSVEVFAPDSNPVNISLDCCCGSSSPPTSSAGSGGGSNSGGSNGSGGSNTGSSNGPTSECDYTCLKDCETGLIYGSSPTGPEGENVFEFAGPPDFIRLFYSNLAQRWVIQIAGETTFLGGEDTCDPIGGFTQQELDSLGGAIPPNLIPCESPCPTSGSSGGSGSSNGSCSLPTCIKICYDNCTSEELNFQTGVGPLGEDGYAGSPGSPVIYWSESENTWIMAWDGVPGHIGGNDPCDPSSGDYVDPGGTGPNTTLTIIACGSPCPSCDSAGSNGSDSPSGGSGGSTGGSDTSGGSNGSDSPSGGSNGGSDTTTGSKNAIVEVLGEKGENEYVAFACAEEPEPKFFDTIEVSVYGQNSFSEIDDYFLQSVEPWSLKAISALSSDSPCFVSARIENGKVYINYNKGFFQKAPKKIIVRIEGVRKGLSGRYIKHTRAEAVKNAAFWSIAKLK